MPIVISLNLPAALILGAMIKDKSDVLRSACFFFDSLMIALIPKLVVPLLIILIPAETKIRLLKSRGTKSATVPNATKSSKSTNIGSCDSLFFFRRAILNASRT